MVMSLKVVDTHTMGEPTRILVEGLPMVEGNTMAEKKEFLEKNLDYVRTALMHEPRGHRDMFGAIILSPILPQADIGIVFMNSGSYLNMCGHGSIGVAMAAVETGMVEVKEPVTIVRFDTPAGLIEARVSVSGGKATEVTIKNVPSFLYLKNQTLEISGLGMINFDISFGGNFFALVNVKELGLNVETENLSLLIAKGMRIMEEINKNIKVHHPIMDHIQKVDLIEIYEAVEEGYKNVVIFGARQFDRSPCGTGTSAKMAALYSKGQLAIGEDFINHSIIGTTFKGRITGITKVGEYNAVIPEITGRAFITGCCNVIIDDEDPLKYGFLI